MAQVEDGLALKEGRGIAIRRDYERTQRAVKQETHKNKGLLLPVGQYGPTAAANRDLW